MKPLRLASCFFTLTLLAQAPEPNERAALNAWDAFAIAGNAWITGHNEMITNRADSARLAEARKLWKKFDRLSREAKL